MSKCIYSSFSQNSFYPLLNSESDQNSPLKLPPLSPSIEKSETPRLPLESKLIYTSNTRKNPLAYTALFKNFINEETKAKITATSTKDLLSFYKIRAEEESQILKNHRSSVKFNSNFESGNLYKAYEYKENEFVLVLKPDYGNIKYTHWFYYRAKAKYPGKVIFHIVNMIKKDLGLMKGQKIVAKVKDQWEPAGDEYDFQETSEFSEYVEDTSCFCLTFSYIFADSKEVSFAYSYPYTYSNLNDWIVSLKHLHHETLSVQPLCTTLGGNICPLLTITHNVKVYLELKKSQISDKKAIIFMGRVHPSESPSSYIMQGLVNFLLGCTNEAKLLRKNFVFKIIPMMNPDGVKYGNSRCSLLGVDLNRRWAEANEIFHPEVYYAKEMIRNAKEMHEIAMCCDIHSHAKKRNIFMYGCRANSEKSGGKKNLLMKMVPILMAKKNKDFSYKDCNFKIEKDKEGTGRVVMYKEFGIINSYTIETSFFGRDNNESFDLNDWENVGCDLAKVCLNLTSMLTIKNSLKIALEWYKKKKASKKKNAKICKMKLKKTKPSRLTMEIEVQRSSSSDEANDFSADPEKLPKIHSPRNKIVKISSFIQKDFSKSLKPKILTSQRTLKGSVDVNSSRKLLETFQSIDLFSENSKFQLKSKLIHSPEKKKNRFPAINIKS